MVADSVLQNLMSVQDLADLEDDFTTAQTPSSAAEVESPATAVTTPRPRFPSDLKTLACTWPGCPKTFNRPARLRDHLNSHTNSRPFKCPYEDCGKDYIEDKHLKQHIKATHTHERKHVCQREGCGKSFVTGTRLKRHQAVHEGADRFRCQDCGQSFRKKETLTKHVRKDHLGQAAHLCPQAGCGEAFHSKGALNRHKEREHGEIKYWCSECAMENLEDDSERPVGFTSELLLQAHLKQEHQSCMFCDFKASGQWDMERHVEMHHSGKTLQDRKTELCPHDGCGKKFTKKSNLNVHIRTAHEGFRFVCGELELASPLFEGWANARGCGDKFSTKAKLEDHVRFIHLGHERPRLSKPDTARDANLVDEISGVSNHAKHTISCLGCDAMFTRYADLDAHISTAHGAGFEAPQFLQQHDQGPASHLDQDSELPAWADEWLQQQEDEEEVAEEDEEEIFAGHMDYGPPQDDWLEDEANILLLARETQEGDALIDPLLHVP